MDTETLLKANQIKGEIDYTKRILNRIEKKTAVEITFYNGGFCCGSNQSDYLSDEDVAEIKADITERIRVRVQTRLDELEEEFNNL